MIDREIVATRLSRLREALRHLGRIASLPRDEYLASETDRALSEHYLRLALEASFDTGNHIVAAQGLRKPLVLRDIPLILGEAGILGADLASRLARAAGLRNRLVHGYASIDHGLLYDVLQRNLDDLGEYAGAVAALCQASADDGPPPRLSC